MAHSNPRILSQPHRVRFAGFESTTRDLQRAGWQLSVEEAVYDYRIRLAMRFEPAGLYMLADAQEHRYNMRSAPYSRSFDPRSQVQLTFDIRHCSSRVAVQLRERGFDFRPIDAEQTYVDTPFKRIEDFHIFASPLVRTEEIIIEPQSVAECLDLIRKMQAPELAAVRKRNLQRERSEPMNQQNFHAQILSLAA